MLMAFAAAVGMSGIVLLAGRYVLMLFTSDEGVIEIGLRAMWIMAPFYFTYVVTEILAGAVRGMGDALIPMLMSCLGLCVLRVVWILTVVPHYGTLESIIIGYPIAWATTSLMFLVYYLQGGWLKRCKKKAGHPDTVG